MIEIDGGLSGPVEISFREPGTLSLVVLRFCGDSGEVEAWDVLSLAVMSAFLTCAVWVAPSLLDEGRGFCFLESIVANLAVASLSRCTTQREFTNLESTKAPVRPTSLAKDTVVATHKKLKNIDWPQKLDVWPIF